MGWIRIVDWEKLQHYKDRSPPWIKLHREQVLDDRRYRNLPDGAQARFWDLCLLAAESRYRGKVKDDFKDLEFRLRRPREEIAADVQRLADAGLVDWPNTAARPMLADASGPLAGDREPVLAPASKMVPRGEERRGEREESRNGGNPELREAKASVRRVLSGEEAPAPRIRKP